MLQREGQAVTTTDAIRSPSDSTDSRRGTPMDMHYPERWLNDRRINRLPDPDHRALVLALTWCVANRTDGIITAEDLADLPRGVDSAALDRLATAGLLTDVVRPDGTVVQMLTDYMTTQSTAAAMNANDLNRVLYAEAARIARAAKKSEPKEVKGHVTPTRQYRTGQRQDKTASRDERYLKPAAEDDVSWPVVKIGAAAAADDGDRDVAWSAY